MDKTYIEKLRNAHVVLKEHKFEHKDIVKGYADRTLRIDLDKNEVTLPELTEEMKELWTGGRGFDLWLMFQEINKDTKWDSNNNPICFSSGPLGGVASFPGAGKTIATSISPLTHTIIDCNVGGYFGPYFKFAGFDALTVVGKAEEDVVVYIDAVTRTVKIEKAPLESIDSHVLAEELTNLYADDDEDRRNIAVVSAGRGAQHTFMGVLNFSFWDWRRGAVRLKQAGRGGIGSVLRNKNIKAIVVKNREVTPGWKVSKQIIPEPIKVSDCKCSGDTSRDEIKKIISKWNKDPEYVIEMMQDIQEKERFISKQAITDLCYETGVPKGQLYHIATFYKAFSLEPKGETIVQVCMGTACHVKGAPKIIEAFERELKIKNGETTEDGKYSLESVACLGCCSIAPVAKIGDKIVGNVQAKDVSKLLKN